MTLGNLSASKFEFCDYFQSKIKTVLKSLHDKWNLTEKKISSFTCYLGILYGQAKVHKPVINNCPSFRPIIDAINTPSYKLAKILMPILFPLTIDEHTLKDSFEFAKEITRTYSNYAMANLDVESLFINMPLEEII